MATFSGPSITTNGLILDLDAANIKCSTGEPTTNLATSPKDVTVGSTTMPTRTNNQVVNYDGTLTGGLLSGAGWLARILTFSAGRYVTSWVVKAGTNTTCDFSWGGSHAGNRTNFTFNLLTGAFTSITQASGEIYGAESLGNGWWQVYYSSSISSTAYYIPQLNNGAGTMYLGFMQIEARRLPTALVDGTRSTSVGDVSGNSYTSTLTDGPTYNAVNTGGQRNLFIYSEDFTNGAWYRPAVSVDSNTVVSPFGNQVADKAYGTVSTGYHTVAQGYNVVANTVYTYSIYAKSLQYTKIHLADGYNGIYNCSVDLSNGTVISSGGASLISTFVESLPDSWYRISVTFKPSSSFGASLNFGGYPDGATTGLYGVQYTGDGASGIAVFGGQLEIGPFATAYQKVVAAGVFDDTNKPASFVFDGLNDMIRIPSPSDRFAWTPSGAGNNNLSIEMWVKHSDSAGYTLSRPWNGSGEYNYTITNGGFSTQVGAQSHNLSFSSYPLNTGSWEHVCAIVTPTEKAVYRNGVLRAGFTAHSITNNTPASGNGNLDICLMSLYPYNTPWAGNTGFSVVGSIGAIRIYNRVLSAAEVLQNYNALRGRFGV